MYVSAQMPKTHTHLSHRIIVQHGNGRGYGAYYHHRRDAVADDEVGLSLELKLDLNAANPVLEIL